MASTATPEPRALLSESSRVIPGMVSAAQTAAGSKRSRNKKGPKSEEVAPEKEQAVLAPVVVEESAAVEEKKTSATSACLKKIKVASKKIQRIETYESKTDALNEDQKAAIKSKPALEAVVKELQELLQILKDEEVEEDSRLQRVKADETRQADERVDAATAAAALDSQAVVVHLLEFLHLHQLYTTSSGFAPPVLPSVVANATGNEVAAVRYLNDAFVSGPKNGATDALDTLNKLFAADESEVVLQVSFARINELVKGIHSPVEELKPDPIADADDSVTSQIAGSLPEPIAAPTPSFLQASELVTENPIATLAAVAAPPPSFEEKVNSWADEVEDAIPAPAPVEPAPVAVAPAAPQGWGAPKALDWANDDDGSLPALEGSFAPAPTPLAPVAAPRPPRAPRVNKPRKPAAPVVVEPEVESDGFVAVPSRAQNSGRGRGGASRGEGRGRGGGRGGRGGAENGGAPRREHSGENGAPRGRGGPGRGAPRGTRPPVANGATGAPVATAPAPVAV